MFTYIRHSLQARSRIKPKDVKTKSYYKDYYLYWDQHEPRVTSQTSHVKFTADSRNSHTYW